MSDERESAVFAGRCLCAAVSIYARHEKPFIGVCHCGICRRWTGGPFMTLECHEPPRIEGEEYVQTYASSEWAERGFCSRCGTHLFYRLAKGGFYALSVGLFEEGGLWPFKLQVFIDEKPGNYEFANRTHEMTGEDVFKAWSP